MTFASGLGACSSVLSLLKSGEHFICGAEVYGGSNRLFTDIISNFGFDVTFVDTTDVEKIVEAIRPNTKVYLF